MAYDDMNRCPQTDEEFREYFYTLIGQRIGAPAVAGEWEAVMTADYPWKGQWLQIPPGVAEGITLPPDAPFFGLTQQITVAPKGRVFLPSKTADDNGFYTRANQYLDDAPSGSGLVWAWYYVAGHQYDPLLPADGGGTGDGGTDGGDSGGGDMTLEERVARLEREAVQRGQKIGLRMASGQVLSVTDGGPEQPNQKVTFESRDEKAGAWEELEVL